MSPQHVKKVIAAPVAYVAKALPPLVVGAGLGLGAYALAGATTAGKVDVKVEAVKIDLAEHKKANEEQWREANDRLKNIERMLMERREAKR